MSMTFLLLTGLIIIYLVIINRSNLYQAVPSQFKIIETVSKKQWFKNPWWSGLLLFLINAVYFGLTGLVLFLLLNLMIPYLHLIIMLTAIIISILTWMAISQAWEGKRSDRLIMSLVGSSFYGALAFYFLWGFLHVEPTYPGEDSFMRAIGWMMGLIVAGTAFITCFSFTTFSKRKGMKG
ncbi:hypothetical protein [Bacillus sp. Marseille-Q3570]|uniref:hypothetical protein n=1 Tax=Bacillus sp. Marseille-Q3570 TaxID=2963522 RepID=UPI0021B72113|nr:hypothetical protein [Bacillus sp. Marseille-Q3570]